MASGLSSAFEKVPCPPRTAGPSDLSDSKLGRAIDRSIWQGEGNLRTARALL